MEELVKQENLYNRSYQTRGRIIISQETGTPSSEVCEAAGYEEEESHSEDSISDEDAATKKFKRRKKSRYPRFKENQTGLIIDLFDDIYK